MKSSGFQPDWVSPPGDTIRDILEERSLSVDEFSKRLGWATDEAQALLSGSRTITSRIAVGLNRVLGGTAEFWSNREKQYRTDVRRLHVENISDAGWLGEIPFRDMCKFGWLNISSQNRDKVSECLAFFEAPNVSSWRKQYHEVLEMAAFRSSPKFQSEPGAVAAWLRQGEILTDAIDCKPWDAKKFNAELPVIRALCRQSDPTIFVPRLTQLCASCGVAIAIVRAPTGCRASGATRFLSSKRAMILLSFRYLTDDQFWFTFFHEAGHLLLHANAGLFLEGVGSNQTKEESEANKFAEEALIPRQYAAELRITSLDVKSIIKLARNLGVSPGIVVGQLQHSGRVAPSKLNSLKRRYLWSP